MTHQVPKHHNTIKQEVTKKSSLRDWLTVITICAAVAGGFFLGRYNGTQAERSALKDKGACFTEEHTDFDKPGEYWVSRTELIRQIKDAALRAKKELSHSVYHSAAKTCSEATNKQVVLVWISDEPGFRFELLDEGGGL
jgi:hypothetical protein